VWEKLFRRGPSAFTMHVHPSGAEVRVQSDESLLQAALRQGLAFPHNCRVGGCGECKCRLVSGKVKELTDKSYLLSAEELDQNYVLACQSQPRSDVVVEVALRTEVAAHPVVQATGRVTERHVCTPDILHVRCELDRPMAYTAGQHVEVSGIAPSEAPADVVRSYSFASAPDPARPTQVDFYIRKVQGGRFTEWLFEHGAVGTALRLQGPHGQFGYRPGEAPMLCIAGGSGLGPIKAMLEQALKDGQAQRPLTLVLAARTRSDLYGLEAIDHLLGQWGGLARCVPVLSAEPAASAWSGARGMVADQLRPILKEQLEAQHVWLCGPPAMVSHCMTALRQAGVPAEHIHQEAFLDRHPQVMAQVG
jgi:ferredoxin-NADP reductase/ferredoxin